jgi:thiol-disulfide isomerase/thioredoxin
LRTPLYSEIKGGELEMPIVADLSIGGRFDLKSEEEEAPVTAQRGDVADVPAGAEPGPVNGRVTIVDYKAVWCVPCKELEVRLVALAERYPEVSVRRFDVGDEAPEGMTLPHVKVYDVEGRLIWESGGSPEEIEAGLVRILAGLRNPE